METKIWGSGFGFDIIHRKCVGLKQLVCQLANYMNTSTNADLVLQRTQHG